MVDTGQKARAIAMTTLVAHCAAILGAAGLDAGTALLVAESLVDAEGRGISSHGVARMRIYATRLRAGLLDASGTVEIVRDGTASVQIDAHNAIGHVGAVAGVDEAIKRAEEAGVGIAGVFNSNHCGALAYFARRATARGFPVIAMSTAPPTMAYFGGRTRAVGTNPICFAVPRSQGAPIVVDMATSGVARGKIILSHQLGGEIPMGWAIDADGVETTDAAAALAGSMLPFAGPKGSGIAMMIDLMCGAMVSGVTGWDIGDMYEDWTRPQRVSHLFIVLNPDAWAGAAQFSFTVEAFVGYVHGLPPGRAVEGVLLPGEVEDRAIALAMTDGVVLADEVIADLNGLAEEFAVGSRIKANDSNGALTA